MIYFQMFLFNRESTNLPLQQMSYFPTTTQQKGRPRKRKVIQSEETIIGCTPDSTPGSQEHHLSHEGALRLGGNYFIDYFPYLKFTHF